MEVKEVKELLIPSVKCSLCGADQSLAGGAIELCFVASKVKWLRKQM